MAQLAIAVWAASTPDRLGLAASCGQAGLSGPQAGLAVTQLGRRLTQAPACDAASQSVEKTTVVTGVISLSTAAVPRNHTPVGMLALARNTRTPPVARRGAMLSADTGVSRRVRLRS